MPDNNEPEKEKTVELLRQDAEKNRKSLRDMAYRRDDGVIQCPPAYAFGYGF